jgi:hypothetical protein
MGVCQYCAQKAGWFSDAHEEFIQKAEQCVGSLKSCVAEALVNGQSYEDIRAQLDKLAADSAVPKTKVIPAIKDGWSQGVAKRSVIQPISDQEFSAISDFYRAAGLTQDEMRQTHGFRAAVFSFLIWTVLHDQIEAYQGPINFKLQSGEVPVFGIANVLLSEERSTSSYVGGYSGASIRIANGLYYHLGGLRGHKVQSSSLQEIDYGDFLMTTEGIYFGGREHGINFRLPYKQVIRFQPYSDAVGICKNGSKEKILLHSKFPSRGWFLFNVLHALAARESQGKAQQIR